MKRLVLALIILSLITIGAVVFAQRPEMMDSGMMGGPNMMNVEQSNELQTQNTSAGADIFNTYCNICHVNGGNVINPAMPLRGSTKLANFENFLAFIRNPKMPDGSRGAMPSFLESQISNKQAEELYQFITSSDSDLTSGGQGGWTCPRYGQCRGFQTRYPMGSGMVGTGQQGWNYCPYCGQPLGQRGYGMMGGGYGMGPGMMRGYGGYGMMEPGYYQKNEPCQKFLDESAGMRKDLHNKKFEYFEAIRNPKTSSEAVANLEKEIRELQEKIYSKAPLGCWAP